jgi:glycosyltransferase involved in cell wall biosynthesis
MRVLHLVKTSVGATWALRQMRELVKQGVDVHVALPPGPLVPAYRASGVTVHPFVLDLPLSRPWRCPELFRRFRALVDRVGPDLIHSHFVTSTLIMRLALGKAHPCPRVFQVPGPFHLEHPFFQQGELLTAGPADHWIGSCRWTSRKYRSLGAPAERVFLSYYGVDLEQFRLRPPGKLRQELGAAPATKLVGMVAYVYGPKWYMRSRRGIKGHEDLIDALVICRRSDPSIRGVFVGGAWGDATAYEQKIRDYAMRRLGDGAVFLGTRDDVPDLYADFDVVAHPSHTENVGGAAESLIMAVPTIATQVGGFPDVISPGETGWLVPPRNPEALAAAIHTALRDPVSAREKAIRGQKLVREMFDVSRTSAKVASIYRTILSAQGSARKDEPAAGIWQRLWVWGNSWIGRPCPIGLPPWKYSAEQRAPIGQGRPIHE